MAHKKSLEELKEEIEKVKQDKKVAEQELKKYEHLEQELTRRARTHQLCTRGGMLEKYINPEVYSDQQVGEILRLTFQLPEVIEILNRIKQESESG